MMHVAHPTASSPSLQISPHNSSVPSLMTPHPNSKATRFISDVCIDALDHPCRDKALQVLKSTEEKKSCHYRGRKPACTWKNRLTLDAPNVRDIFPAVYGQANALFLFCFWYSERRASYRGRVFLARFHSIVSGSLCLPSPAQAR